MQALGLIETRGLLPAIECADVMLKTAQVELVERTVVGGGLVTIIVAGDVGAVKTAVEAGVAAVEKIGRLALVSQHVIPRPHRDIAGIVVVRANANPVEEQPIPGLQQEKASLLPGCEPTTNINEPLPNQDAEIDWTEPVAAITASTNTAHIMLKNFHKEEIDAFVQQCGLEKGVNALQSLSVEKLRKLAREYKELDIAGRAIAKANKALLIQRLKGYYERGNKQ